MPPTDDLDISSLNSILELLAAFNYALVISGAFLKDLNIKLTGSLGDARSMIKKIKAKITETERYIKECSEKDSENKAIINYTVELITISNDTNSLKDIIKEKAYTLSTSSWFQRYCLFSGIYCCVMLIIAAFETKFIVDILEEAIIIFNVVALFFLIILKPKAQNEINNAKQLLTALRVYLYTIPFPVLAFIILEELKNYHCPVNLTILMKATIIFVPAFHFIVFFISALVRSNRIGKKNLKDGKAIFEKLNQLSSEVSGILNYQVQSNLSNDN